MGKPCKGVKLINFKLRFNENLESLNDGFSEFNGGTSDKHLRL